MRVTITALKAPWPEGSRVGSVVELEGDTIPAWAHGKCTPAVIMGGGGSGPPTLPSAAEMDEIKAAFEDLRNQLTVAESEGASSRTQLAAAQEEVAALRAMLAGGGGSGPPTLPNVSTAETPARRRG